MISIEFGVYELSTLKQGTRQIFQDLIFYSIIFGVNNVLSIT